MDIIKIIVMPTTLNIVGLFVVYLSGGLKMKVIVGLGNPGSKYDKTKHNVGFEVIDSLADSYNINVTKLKHKGFVGEGNIKGEKVILLKPQTYMNLSGESLKELITFYKISVKDIIVVYDDISLPVGNLRIRLKGSAGGHNGIKNIIAHLGTDEFTRVKVGIGEKPNGWDLADYVLSKFSKDDEPLILKGIERSAEAVAEIIEHGANEAMNKYNQKVG